MRHRQSADWLRGRLRRYHARLHNYIVEGDLDRFVGRISIRTGSPSPASSMTAARNPPAKKSTSFVQLFDVPVLVYTETVFDFVQLALCRDSAQGLDPAVEALQKVRLQHPYPSPHAYSKVAYHDSLQYH